MHYFTLISEVQVTECQLPGNVTLEIAVALYEVQFVMVVGNRLPIMLGRVTKASSSS